MFPAYFVVKRTVFSSIASVALSLIVPLMLSAVVPVTFIGVKPASRVITEPSAPFNVFAVAGAFVFETTRFAVSVSSRSVVVNIVPVVKLFVTFVVPKPETLSIGVVSPRVSVAFAPPFTAVMLSEANLSSVRSYVVLIV